ncbi:phosphatase PAP2 family protein [Sphingomonas aracearum]|uniref:Phosphatase PAP2 family protein n=1 Tax=Sphingomonas aracearum TaxID=2283317 RepID=A0A369VX72_9SPHN|nr:phosphatase PAP2 family protein [Sphingomonas aracearum]RDE06928.1 phosphatase PAP2 family protein [Sphingomonas aracearum]
MTDKHRKKSKAEKLDAALSDRLAASDAAVIRLGGAASELTDQPPLVLLSLGTAAVGALRRDPAMVRAGARMLLAHAIATQAKAAIKRRVDRTRPDAASERGTKGKLKKGRRYERNENAFPSGHTAGAVAVARAVARDYPAAAPLAHSAAVAAAAIQVPRGTHYPGDVLAGALIGLAAEPLASRLVDWGERALLRVARRRRPS